MGISKKIFIQMNEDEYNLIPPDIKERFFTSKNVTSEIDDFSENMKDEMFSRLYREKKKAQKALEDRQYHLREERRKIK